MLHRQRSAIGNVTRDRQAIQTNLLSWFDREKRALPWRTNVTPYRVWVSEVMLQQTQVSTVIPYFRLFLRRFPSIPALAEASLDEVMEVWSGLGYYRRARRLHEAAQILVKEHKGRFPKDLHQVLALPGIGRYTAGAILSIACNQRCAIVDGNISRLLHRLFGVSQISGSRLPRSGIWELAESLVPGTRPGDFNQAMMELGAQICKPQRPRCALCPIASFCAACQEGFPNPYSPISQKGKSVRRNVFCLVIQKSGTILIVRDQSARWYADVWHLPLLDTPSFDVSRREIAGRIKRSFGLSVKVECFLAEKRFSITTHRVKQKMALCTVVSGRIVPARGRSTRWVSPGRLPKVGLPSSQRVVQHASWKGRI